MRLKIFLVLVLSLLPRICFAAVDSAILWEIRTTGQSSSASMNNGGGFKVGASGTDYSFASIPANGAPESTRTDLVIGSAGSEDELSSAGDAFAADDIGNIIHITAGTNFTIGWYEVLSVAGGVATVDRNVGTAEATGGTGQLGGALALNSALDDDFFEQLTAGNTVYISGGGAGEIHTLGEGVNVDINGTYTDPITVEGYDSSRGDNPTLTDRPTIAAAAQYFAFDNYWRIKNLILTSTHNYGLALSNYSIAENFKSTNTSGNAYEAFVIGTGSKAISCEATSTNGYGIQMNTYVSNIMIIGCYIRDSSVGIYISNNTSEIDIIGNITDTCATGLRLPTTNENDMRIISNTFYNSTTGIDGGDTFTCIITNNLFDECTTPASWSTEYKSNYFDYNSWDGDASSNVNITEGDNSIDVDITLTDPAGGDFTLPDSSAAEGVGLQVSPDTGLKAGVDTNWNIGQDQTDTQAGGGAATTSYGFMQ